MTYDYPMHRSASPRLRAPADGIVASHRQRGWLARRWMANLSRLGPSHAARLARGRTFARGGRARGLWFAPGLANAEVVDTEPFQVSIRVRVFGEDEWDRVTDVLEKRLVHIAELLEGRLTADLLDALNAAGTSLVPTLEDIDGDCDCADYLMPCAHAAAVHDVLADALDGDPFLLFTLRGRTRHQLTGALRKRWGDDTPLLPASPPHDEELPNTDDWYGETRDLARLQFALGALEGAATGLRVLGPPPGDVDLTKTLTPLYKAGAKASIDLAVADTPGPAPIRTMGHRRRAQPRPAPVVEEVDFTEQVVNILAELEEGTAITIAGALSTGVHDVRRELFELETMGAIVRDVRPEGTFWLLG